MNQHTQPQPQTIGVRRHAINDGASIRIYWVTTTGELIGDIEARMTGPDSARIIAQDFARFVSEEFGGKIVVAGPGAVPNPKG